MGVGVSVVVVVLALVVGVLVANSPEDSHGRVIQILDAAMGGVDCALHMSDVELYGHSTTWFPWWR